MYNIMLVFYARVSIGKQMLVLCPLILEIRLHDLQPTYTVFVYPKGVH